MHKSLLLLLAIPVFSLPLLSTPFPQSPDEPRVNPLIDYEGFQTLAQKMGPVRAQRRVSEEQFAQFALDRQTVVLDARSADKYALRHIAGAVSLPFTDFTEDSLAKVIPTKNTRVLIYCNNNFLGAPISLGAKSARASLNISTYIALATYGYDNIYELAPLLDVRTTKLTFVGTEMAGQDARQPQPTTSGSEEPGQ